MVKKAKEENSVLNEMNQLAHTLEVEKLVLAKSVIAEKDEDGNINFLGEPVKEFFDIFQKKPEAKIIVWAHPKFASEFSAEKNELPPILEDVAQVLGARVKHCSLRIIGEMNRIIEKENSFFVEEGGVLVIAKNEKEALLTISILEKGAMVYLEAKKIGGAKLIPGGQGEKLHEKYKSDYSQKEKIYLEATLNSKEEEITGQDADKPAPDTGHTVEVDNQGAIKNSPSEVEAEDGNETLDNSQAKPQGNTQEASPKERELRQKIIATGKEIIEEKLVIGTWGNISARLDQDWMLVTPSGVSYDKLEEKDIVKVNIKTQEVVGTGEPTTEKKLHSQVYLTKPEVRAIIHTHPNYASVFAAAQREIPITSKLMKQLVEGPVPVAPYEVSGSDKIGQQAAKLFDDKGVKVILLSNHGMVTIGAKLQDVLETTKVVEDEGKAYILNKNIRSK